MIRLSTISEELVDLILNGRESQLEVAVRRIVEHTLASVPLEDVEGRGLSDLALSGNWSDESRALVQAYAEYLDEEAFDAYDQVEAGSLAKESYLVAFARARVGSMLLEASQVDIRERVLETTYEAQAALGGISELTPILVETLS